MSGKVRLKDGCTGCDRLWNSPGSEGQCSRCRRCLECCNREGVRYSCAARWRRRCAADPGYAHRSKRAYDRFVGNPNVLRGHRRITF